MPAVDRHYGREDAHTAVAPPLPDRAAVWCRSVLCDLAHQPVRLLVLGLALNSLFLPYAGLYHDARLYAAQVFHVEDGRLAGDLFFRYGSQTKHTIFPTLLASLSEVVGVERLFLVAYLACNVVRLWAYQKLIYRLVGPSAAAAVGTLAFAVAPVWMGQGGVFSVNEWFFTARVPAVACAFLGLERLLAARLWAAAGWLALGLLVHPLMAGPAAAVAAGWTALAWASTPTRRLLLLGAGALLLLGVGVFLARTAGTLDAEWKALVFGRSPHVRPGNWRLQDWVRLALGAGCAVALARPSAPPVRRLLYLVTAAAAGGAAAGVASCLGSWALLFQIQPVRGVWLLEAVSLPVGLAVAGRLWAAHPSHRLPACALALGLVAGTDLLQPDSAAVFLACFVGGVVVAYAVGWSRDAGAFWRGLVLGGLGWGAVWYLAVKPSWVYAMIASGDLATLPPMPVLGLLAQPFGLAFRLACVMAVLAVVGRRALARLGIAPAAAVAAAGTLLFLVLRSDAAAGAGQAEDARFVRAYLDTRAAAPYSHAVYWPGHPVEDTWFRLNQVSYFHPAQLSGNIFSRPTAVEGDRRVRLVAPFEVERIRDAFPHHPELSGEDIGPAIRMPPPTADSLRALAADPEVDLVVLPYDLGGAAATNGRVFIYDCRAIRSSHSPDTSGR